MAKALKNRASKQSYTSASQMVLSGFESPFSQHLLVSNRWVTLANRIPWDALVNTYYRQLGNQYTGAGNINPRVAIGALIIKHLCNISDRETILQIQENMYMQYFIGYTSFTHEEPFDPSLFVDIRKRLTLEHINEINEKILGLIKTEEEARKQNISTSTGKGQPNEDNELPVKKEENKKRNQKCHSPAVTISETKHKKYSSTTKSPQPDTI